MADMDQYAGNFVPGMKVGVAIPLSNAEIFTDWAIIHEVDEDLVSLQLSRDQLPVRVALYIGQILELRAGSDDNHYSCRAIIVSEGFANRLKLRLIGEIVSDELREFYRIDAFLPIKYYLSSEQRPEVLREQWEHRRQERFAREVARRQRRWDSEFVVGEGDLPAERRPDEEDEEESVDPVWDTIIPLAANISGGGLRINTHQGFEAGEYLLLEILVPSPRRIVDAVARVVFANRNHGADEGSATFNTGLQFIFIDERDRDSVLNHISGVQLQRNRLLRERFALVSDDEMETGQSSAASSERISTLRMVLLWVLMIVIGLVLTAYFWNYAKEHPKNEIGEIFENALRKYLEKQK